MREVKFRAWVKSSASFGKVYAINSSEGCVREIGVAMPRGDILRLVNPDSYILEQYAGIKDKNGVEIYEGDIVCFTHDPSPLYRYEVVFVNGVFRLENGLSVPIGDLEVPEVIGNIHENPELLEGEK